jgi:hypothetical protein
MPRHPHDLVTVSVLTRSLHPSAMSAATTCAATAVAAGAPRRSRRAARRSLPASCTTMSFAVFGPIPRRAGTGRRPRRDGVGDLIDAERRQHAEGRLGTDPDTLTSRVERLELVALGESDSRRRPTWSERATEAGTATLKPTPPTSTIADSASRCSTRPRSEEIMAPP